MTALASRSASSSDLQTSAGLDRGPLYTAADRAQQRLGRPVNPTVITTDRWARRGTGQDRFIDEVASRPIVPVSPGAAGVIEVKLGACALTQHLDAVRRDFRAGELAPP